MADAEARIEPKLGAAGTPRVPNARARRTEEEETAARPRPCALWLAKNVVGVIEGIPIFADAGGQAVAGEVFRDTLDSLLHELNESIAA